MIQAHWVHRVLLVLVLHAMAATSAPAQAEQWHSLIVPGGRATLRALGVDDSRERAAVMIELIRRLQFRTASSEQLEAAIQAMPVLVPNSPLQTSVTLPNPISHASWERVLGRTIALPALMRAILADVPARLLFHGLSGLDAGTRQWFETEPDLLRSIYRDLDAAKSFAMFAPAIEVSQGRIVVRGGAIAESRWSKALGAVAAEPRRFVSRLFLERAGRAAGLYFLASTVEDPRRRFVLHESTADGDQRFAKLIDTFSACYPREANDYPFALRSNDPVILLLGETLDGDGRPFGPRSSGLWDAALDANELSPQPASLTGRDIDAAWLVDRLCSAVIRERGPIIGTLLAGQRVFPVIRPEEAADVVVALRVRRLFPAVFMAMERSGVRTAASFAVVGRRALALDRLNDGQSTSTVLQQFQGVLAMLLRASASGTLSQGESGRLLASLADVRVTGGRYDGRMALWIDRELLPAFGFVKGDVAEFSVARALAGPTHTPVVRMTWEDHDYILDYSRTLQDRLIAVRQKQGGGTLDRALELARAARTAHEKQAADALLGEVLASWTYAPHVGGPDSGALVGGDGSRRHDLGLREVNRTRFEQRWALAVTPGDRGIVAGSYLGLEAALAGWSLRRLSTDTIPPQPTLGDNDRMSLFATVSVSDPAQVDIGDSARIASAIEEGRKRLSAAGNDAAILEELARTASMSPWWRAAIRWMLAEEPARIPGLFSLSALARIGGLAQSTLPAWGTSAIRLGCLCLAPPLDGAPELIAGRPVDGIVGTRSADLALRIAELLSELKMPAKLMPAVLAYAMRDYIDRLRPMHPADTDAFARAASLLTRTMVEDYLGAIAAVGPLRPVQ